MSVIRIDTSWTNLDIASVARPALGLPIAGPKDGRCYDRGVGAAIFVLAAMVTVGCAIDRLGTGAEPDARARLVDGGDTTRDGGELDARPLDAPTTDAAVADAGDGGAMDDAGADAGPTSAPCDAADPGLIACYAFDGDLSDGSMYRNDASGSARWASGRVGQALGHEVGDTISIPASATLVPTVPASMEMFLRPDALPSMGRVGVLDHPGEWAIFLHPGGEVSCSFEAPIWLNAGAVLATGRWTHVGCTYDGSEQRLYVDGELVASQPLARSTSLSASTVRIGANAPDGEWYEGRIDELRVYRVARTAAQVRAAASR